MNGQVKPLVLFDVDGTLLLTGGAGMRAMKKVASELFGAAFRWDGIVVSGHLDPLIFAEAALLNGIDDPALHHDGFRRRYLEELRLELEHGRAGIRVMPGILETLTELRTSGAATLGLLTGNYAEAIPLKLSAIGVDPRWFEITALGEDAATRRDLAALAIEKYSQRVGSPIDPARVIVVGDTPRDVDCAHAHGCFAFAVATGAYDEVALAAAGADRVVRDLGNPTPLLEIVARVGQLRV